MKPIIAINTDVKVKKDRTGDVFDVEAVYVEAVLRAGGIPIVIPPMDASVQPAELVARFDGFIFTGGPDIDPALFRQEPHEKTSPVPKRREDFDFALLAAVLESQKPVLGICLGMQELAVFHGGDIVQHIPDLLPDALPHRRPDNDAPNPTHRIDIEPDTVLARTLGTESMMVNSIHHQSVGNPGQGVAVSARSSDGVIEAIEVAGHPFAIGVQWHPEAREGDDLEEQLFRALVEVAARGVSGAVPSTV